jgi:dihydroneopterin aldolase
MNDKILLKNMKFYGFHGVFEHERELGQTFTVDLEIQLDLDIPGKTDLLADTLDYDECSILENACLIPYQQEQQNRNSLMTQRVTGEYQKQYSQANHIDAVSNVVTLQEEKVTNMITKYSYLASPNNLKGLGGVIT